MSLGTRILIGVLAGIAVGIFLGDLSEPFDVAGKIYLGLLQMTVLPYVTVSLMIKIGGLTYDQARRLAGRAGAVLVALWGLSLVSVFLMAQSLPAYQAGSFFTASLVERPAEFDFLGMYLPTNPFHSLANNVVPAVVLFSILVGVALIGLKEKDRLLEPLRVFGDALGGISDFVMRISPYGTFALAAGAAGTLRPDDMIRLAGYVGTFTIGVLVVTFVVLPTFVAAVTPIGFWKTVKGTREAVLTAFATGKLFAVLPMVIKDVREMLIEQGMEREAAEGTADVFVPLAYPFPNAGKLLSILFIPFAGWFIGQPLEIADYPMLLVVGLFAFFGSPVAAIPFLLDMFRLPTDLLPLFLIAGIWCARLGDMVGAVHLTAFTVISAAWTQGWTVKALPVRLAAWGGVNLAVFLVAIVGNRALVRSAMAGKPPARDLVAAMELQDRRAEIVAVDQPGAQNPDALLEGETHFERIRRTSTLRVGYIKHIPFVYRNHAEDIVGFDIQLIQYFAAELELTLRLVPTDVDRFHADLDNDCFDLVVGGIPSAIRNLERAEETQPYLDLHAAFVVDDARAKEFRTIEQVLGRPDPVRIGYVPDALVRGLRVPGILPVEVTDPRRYLAEEDILGAMEVDAFLTTAETGASIAMIRPELAVVVPQDMDIKVPLVCVVPRSAHELRRVLDKWIVRMEKWGRIDEIYRYWILGKRPGKKQPRWSVVRDVLGWAD